jgi:AraC-like DNA-binding protein/quercetin dioxygenase-like cupin family protein
LTEKGIQLGSHHVKRAKRAGGSPPSFLGAFTYAFLPGWRAPAHKHSSGIWELLLVTQGVMGVSTDGKESRGAVGSIYIYPPKWVHQESCLSKVELRMQALLWKDASPSASLPLQTFDQGGYVHQALSWMQNLQSEPAFRHAILNRLLEVILFECTRRRDAGETDRISEVARYIDDHAGERLNVERLAKIACMSKSHFAHEFRRRTSLSPMAYVRKARLDRACKALVQTPAGLRQIALDAGFRDEFEFSRVFRRIMGVAPGSLRKRH